MIFVKFKIEDGACEYFDYSWFKDYGEAHYENGESITDKDMIQAVYGDDEEEIFENNYDDDTNTYENYNNDWVSVYSVKDITPKELDVLDKFGVVYK